MVFLGWFLFTIFCSVLAVLSTNWFFNKIFDNVL